MKKITAAFQGEPGAYSEIAALDYFGENGEPIPHPSFDSVFSAVLDGTTDVGMIPIENSLAGSIHRNYDLMLRNNLFIIGEYHLRINHNLMALPGVKIESLRTVHSHPQALAQCEANIRKLGLEQVVEADTAGSARLLRDLQDPTIGVLASRRAAEVYGLEILVDSMEDSPTNFTRFLILSKTQVEKPINDYDDYKTSIVFSLNNKPGVLFKALSVFALREIDLTKIESRPIPGLLWEYVFYIDFIGHSANPNCNRALDHLNELSTYQRVLGSYPRHRLELPSGNEI
jgi:arogenate/prephenate dehydratase